MKPRINVYLEDHVDAQLTLLCKRPGSNKSRIVNEALERLFNPEREDETGNALLRRLDRMSRSMDRMDRNQSIMLETLALFIRYFLTVTPPLNEWDQASAHALGKERFEAFVAQVGRRLALDRNLLSEVLESIADTRPDLFTTDPDAADPEAAPPTKKSEPVDDSGKSSQHHVRGTAGATDQAEGVQPEGLPPLRPVFFEDEEEEYPFEDYEILDDLENEHE